MKHTIPRLLTGSNVELTRNFSEPWNSSEPSGPLFANPNISSKEPDLYRDHGVNLSEKKIDIFFSDLQQRIKEPLGLGMGARILAEAVTWLWLEVVFKVIGQLGEH